MRWRIAFSVAPFLVLAAMALALSGCGPARLAADLAACAAHPRDCN